ncbi:energy-coupling factor transporter transmembrane protein EcfT [Clostridia bacterium]|nr:energy-coupling factor transporter transmembrane protein EcfT [Clostridia bacterium]
MANPIINIFFLVMVLALYRIAKVPKAYFMKFLPFGITLTFFLFLTYAFFPSIYIDPPYKYNLITIGAFTYHFENLIVSIAMWLRWMPAIFGALFVFAIIDEKDINIALKTLRVPFFLRLVIATGLRCFFSFYYDAMQILEAQKARGLDFMNMNIFRRLKYYIAILVPLVMIEMQKADSMSDAADSRGYVPFDEGTGEKIERTEFIGRDVVMEAKDKVVLIGAILLFVVFIGLNAIPETSAVLQWVPSSMSELISL